MKKLLIISGLCAILPLVSFAMKAVNVGANSTNTVAAAGNRMFVAVQNVSVSNLYVKYDGSTTLLTAATGQILKPNAILFLSNDGTRSVFIHDVEVFNPDTSTVRQVRIQGED